MQYENTTKQAVFWLSGSVSYRMKVRVLSHPPSSLMWPHHSAFGGAAAAFLFWYSLIFSSKYRQQIVKSIA